MLDKQATIEMVRSYLNWKNKPSRKNMGRVIKTLEPTINIEMNNYKGVIADGTLKGLAKKVAIDSIRSYDPSKKTALSTHVKSQMKRLYRVNYESSNIRLPENLQQGIGGFLRAKEYLEDTLGREPTVAELSDELHWSIKKVTQVQKRLRNEISDTQLEFSPVHTEASPFGEKIDYFYNDLSIPDKLIFEHTTGYGGKRLLNKGIIAKKIGISAPRVSQKVYKLTKQLKQTLGVNCLKDL